MELPYSPTMAVQRKKKGAGGFAINPLRKAVMVRLVFVSCESLRKLSEKCRSSQTDPSQIFFQIKP
jgi:hypothetical protein